MLGAVEFDFPIRRPDNRLIGHSIRVAAVRALLTADGTRLVRARVDVNDIGHSRDYTADADKQVLPSADAGRNAPLIHRITFATIFQCQLPLAVRRLRLAHRSAPVENESINLTRQHSSCTDCRVGRYWFRLATEGAHDETTSSGAGSSTPCIQCGSKDRPDRRTNILRN